MPNLRSRLPLLLRTALLLLGWAGGAIAQAQEGPPRCGTALIMDALAHRQKGEKLLLFPCEGREVRQNNVVTAGGHFRVHYDVSGPAAVAPADENMNGVPDYVDSVAFYLENAWAVEIDELGFAPPPPDNRGPGPEVDVYICELGTQIYGFALPEVDNPTGPETVSGFLVLDNDYVGFPTPGVLGARVTIAHELHHIIQFSRYRYDLSQSSLYEATSTWLERQVEPTIPDYRQYIDSLIRTPQNYAFSTHATRTTVTGYAHVLYLDYLARRTASRDVVRSIWEKFAQTPLVPDAIDNALRPFSLSLSTSWCEFANWTYHTGTRANDSLYFPEGSAYPSMRGRQTLVAGDEEVRAEGKLFPLSFVLYQIAVPGANPNVRDTVDLLLTNARSNFGKGGLLVPADPYAVTVVQGARDGFRPLRGASDSIYLRVEAGSAYCYDVIIGGSPVALLATKVSPQPFVNDGAERLVVAVPAALSQTVDAIELVIYTVDMVPVATIQQQGLTSANGQLGVVWDGRTERGEIAPSGVYLYELTVNATERSVGKFAVIRK